MKGTRRKRLIAFVAIMAVLVCLELADVALYLRQWALLPYWYMAHLLGLRPGLDTGPRWLAAIDVDARGFAESLFRMVMYAASAGLVMGLGPLCWRKATRREFITTEKRCWAVATVTALLALTFAIYTCWVIKTSLFVAWEPGIPGEEDYYSLEHIGYALFCLVGLLGWITIPAMLLIAYLGYHVVRFLRPRQDNAPKDR